MDEAVRRIRLNSAVLDALKEYDKLRIVPHDEAPEGDALTYETGRLIIDERYLLQGARRAMSGDGHGATLKYLRDLQTHVQEVATCARERRDKGSAAGDQKHLFTKNSIQILRELDHACASICKGLRQLRCTTYSGSQQIAVDIAALEQLCNETQTSITTYLLDQAAPVAAAFDDDDEV